MATTITVLIVDDDNDDREMFKEAASEINFDINCIEAVNGHDALQLLKKEEAFPDYIFLDLNMPRMNGRQFLEQFKKNEKFSSIPVIIYTTAKLMEDREEAKELGAVHFISKPSSISALKKELEFVFSKEIGKNRTL